MSVGMEDRPLYQEVCCVTVHYIQYCCIAAKHGHPCPPLIGKHHSDFNIYLLRTWCDFIALSMMMMMMMMSIYTFPTRRLGVCINQPVNEVPPLSCILNQCVPCSFTLLLISFCRSMHCLSQVLCHRERFNAFLSPLILNISDLATERAPASNQ